MKKSDFFALVKSLKAKPDSICIAANSVFVNRAGVYMVEIIACKSETNAAKEMHKFNRWLSQALEEIKPSDTQWMPEEECCQEAAEEKAILANGDFNINELSGFMALNNAINAMRKKSLKCIFFDRPNNLKKQKSPAKMFVRATMNILKQYDCFDSLKNPHWSNLSKKQKKSWARKFGIEMMQCWIDSCAWDFASDSIYEAGHDTLQNTETEHDYYIKNKSACDIRAREQLLAEMDYSSVEEYVEENLNCLW